ncbi:MAG: phosphoribosylanthranilate isomerase [Planctomycetota bacterium]
MPRTRIKICGITSLAAARAAVDAGADALGFVFAQGSPRTIDPAQACVIVGKLPAFVEPVGLFVNTPPDQIADAAERARVTTVQLHGDEGPDAALQLARRFRVVKAVPHDAAIIARWRGISHTAALLVDAPHAPGEPTGGTGRTHDYAGVGNLDRTGMPPLILAGGLTPDNVAAAIHAARPFAVDVSSGVEQPDQPGTKDPDRIAAFCQAVRDADAANAH